MKQAPFFTQPSMLQQEQERRDIRRLRQYSNRSGFAICAFYLLATPFVFLLGELGLAEFYTENAVFSSAVEGILSIICICVPFFLVLQSIGKEKEEVYRALGKPYRTQSMLLAVPVGFLVCLGANIVTTYWVDLMERFGYTLTSPDYTYDTTPLGIALSILQVAVIPAVTEEFAMRGVVMQPLRRYGDRFAIGVSSVLFALMHGNLVQAPFALIIGVAIGYFVITTGSIWTGILIHFVNNLFSVVTSILYQTHPDENVLDYQVNLFFLFAVVLGLICLVAFIRKNRERRLCPASSQLAFGKKMFAYFFTPGMLIALAMMVFITIQYVKPA